MGDQHALYINDDDLTTILIDDGNWDLASSSTNISVWRKKVKENRITIKSVQ